MKFNILIKYKVPNNLINLIKDYTNNSAKLKIDVWLTKSIPVNQGIRQGDSLSPLQFNIVPNERDNRGNERP